MQLTFDGIDSFRLYVAIIPYDFFEMLFHIICNPHEYNTVFRWKFSRKFDIFLFDWTDHGVAFAVFHLKGQIMPTKIRFT